MINPQQQRNSQYARDFQQPDAHKALTAEGLALVAIPGAGHFVQQDASDLVLATMVDWLRRLP